MYTKEEIEKAVKDNGYKWFSDSNNGSSIVMIVLQTQENIG